LSLASPEPGKSRSAVVGPPDALAATAITPAPTQPTQTDPGMLQIRADPTLDNDNPFAPKP
jgi:hypothetical protein